MVRIFQRTEERKIAIAVRAHPTIELLDPLCPTCKAFDTRLKQTEFSKKLDIKSVLFPLDSTCNWMLSTPMHPGACAVSEAMMCAAGVVETGKGSPAERSIAGQKTA